MNDQLIELVAKEIQLKTSIVKQVIDLLDEGNTVPFIARYRKRRQVDSMKLRLKLFKINGRMPFS